MACFSASLRTPKSVTIRYVHRSSTALSAVDTELSAKLSLKIPHVGFQAAAAKTRASFKRLLVVDLLAAESAHWLRGIAEEAQTGVCSEADRDPVALVEASLP
ncbi:unnamed protein product [Trichogramma brassicae]|uniref:Uncharacterized protein n=1 Tax=Trichogramma brassicae TaxID=86971 RepID=A0A6H5IQ20_9HYME|nr:unnamed protein product [Trichogramma brassicae]